MQLCAEAIADVSDAHCTGQDPSDFAVAAASATAFAFAEALAKVYGYCESTTDSLACAWGAGSIEAVAEAVGNRLLDSEVIPAPHDDLAYAAFRRPWSLDPADAADPIDREKLGE